MFTFSDTFYPPAPPSFASLTRNVELPKIFILCSSNKQVRFDDRGFYSVLGEDGSQWLSVIFFQYPEAVDIWIFWDKGMYKLVSIGNPKVNYWYHICLEIDLEENKITASVDGKLVGSVHEQNITNIPTYLKINLGKWLSTDYEEDQFQGSVTNVQAFTVATDHNITALTSQPCGVTGDILAWQVQDWRVEGTRWLLVEELEESVCDQGDNYTVAIPVQMGIHEAMDICKMKLKNSTMPYQEDIVSLQAYTTWYFNITDGLCRAVWTPFSDEVDEGLFVNMFDNTKAAFLPWAASCPNGGTTDNFVRIASSSRLYRDTQTDGYGICCSSCLLDRSLLLRLDGLCEDSYIGDST